MINAVEKGIDLGSRTSGEGNTMEGKQYEVVITQDGCPRVFGAMARPKMAKDMKEVLV